MINSTALKVMWRSLLPGRQHGQIRGYQVHYVRVENGEARGLPLIKDVMLADAQVHTPRTLFTLLTHSTYYSHGPHSADTFLTHFSYTPNTPHILLFTLLTLLSHTSLLLTLLSHTSHFSI